MVDQYNMQVLLLMVVVDTLLYVMEMMANISILIGDGVVVVMAIFHYHH